MKHTIAIILALIIVHGPNAGAARAAETLQPNVIIILADDLGYGDIGCYGSKANQTPHLDRLASEGMRFTDFHSNGPMCSPTRAALLTGRYQQRMGIESALGENSKGLDRREVTIAERLNEAGYATAIFGKWHLGPQPVDAPIHHGFEEFRGHLHGAVDYISHVDRYGRVDWFHNDQPANEEGYNTTLITEHAVRFIETHRNEPFFLYVSHSAIHFPWMTAEDEGYRQPGKRYTDLRKLGPHEDVRPVVQEMIEALDRGVGRIVATLEEHELQRRTLTFFTSDNGGYLHYSGRHRGNISSNGALCGQKGDMYEGGHRVPAIAWWPGMIEPGTVTHETTAAFDLFPTLLHLAGQGDKMAELNLDGQSIAPLLFENAAVAKRTLFWRMRGAKAVRRGAWKLVVRGEGMPQLYNLDDDISEEHDLAAERTDLVRQLKAELSAWEVDVDNGDTAVAPTSQNTIHATNSLGMKLVRIEPGSFTMGSADGEWDERPVHRVTISRPFLMATTEVTNAQYEQFDPGHAELRRYRDPSQGNSEPAGMVSAATATWRRSVPYISQGDDEPVVLVSWHDAVAFCEWLTEKEGKPYRLPTEAECEYACRAGSTTTYSTGDTLPDGYQNQTFVWDPKPVSLAVGQTPPNAWGLYDMHGNVEEWCHDTYGPYSAGLQIDPVGRSRGEMKVSRGGSHNTEVTHLRSANRLGALPDDRNWLIGFRVVQAALPETEPSPVTEASDWCRHVSQRRRDWSGGPDPNRPFFAGPKRFVHISPGSNGPLYSEHNHCPSITWCDNGDLLAIWFSTNQERGREMTIAASRRRAGSDDWDRASVFFKAPDRNMTGSSLFSDGRGTLYHFNGMEAGGGWANLALVMRTSTDNGVTWHTRLINPHHQPRNQVIDGTFQTKEGYLIQPCDAVHGGRGGTTIQISRDGGRTWVEPGAGTPKPDFGKDSSGGTIAGIHAGVVQLADGRLMAFGRGDDRLCDDETIGPRMPMSVSDDFGRSWHYSASPWAPISGGQRLVLRRLDEGPLLLISFTDSSRLKPEEMKGLVFTDALGREFHGYGMFTALSFDEGESWPVRKLLTPGEGQFDGGAWTDTFTTDATHAEPKGYLAATQTPDGVIHLISSALHYQFNLAWLKTPNQLPAQR